MQSCQDEPSVSVATFVFPYLSSYNIKSISNQMQDGFVRMTILKNGMMHLNGCKY